MSDFLKDGDRPLQLQISALILMGRETTPLLDLGVNGSLDTEASLTTSTPLLIKEETPKRYLL